MPEKKPSTGTAGIVTGSILIVWGFLTGLRGVFVADPYTLVSLVLLGIGVAVLVRGLNTRRRHLSRS